MTGKRRECSLTFELWFLVVRVDGSHEIAAVPSISISDANARCLKEIENEVTEACVPNNGILNRFSGLWALFGPHNGCTSF